MTVMVRGPRQQDVSALLADPPDDVPAIVDRLADLQCLLDRMPGAPGGSPIAGFNRFYLRITTGLLERLYDGGFADPAFLARLDVELAARYFDAVRAWSDARPCCPRVWSVLFGRVAAPVPSAAAGINAHISFDLPFALVTTFDQLGSDPVDESDQHRDYRQLGDVFAEAVPGLRRGYLDRWQLLIDTMNGDLDEWWQGEAVTYARNVAWRHAQKLWAIRHDLAASADERARLDDHAAALSRLLLSPLGAVFQ
ncbi:MAG TPA: DUF5995 family protein [Actinoplanes sp.]|jgi:hypothetical protein